MTDQAIIPTQSARLELKEEQAGLREGFRFLDEKRLILAAEMVAEIGRYEGERRDYDTAYAKAGAALRAAIARHGLEGLFLYPPASAEGGGVELNSRSVLGVILNDAGLEPGEPLPPAVSVAASPEADACRAAFSELIPRLARLAAMAANLERLRTDYAHTARRARALEDVLLPEVEEQLKTVETALEELEREEAIRARRGGGQAR